MATYDWSKVGGAIRFTDKNGKLIYKSLTDVLSFKTSSATATGFEFHNSDRQMTAAIVAGDTLKVNGSAITWTTGKSAVDQIVLITVPAVAA